MSEVNTALQKGNDLMYTGESQKLWLGSQVHALQREMLGSIIILDGTATSWGGGEGEREREGGGGGEGDRMGRTDPQS